MTSKLSVRFLDSTSPPHIVTLILIAGISALNMSIFLPSLNNMTQYFDTSYSIMQISLSGYLAVTAILQLFVGAISDRYGRRKLVLWSVAIFVCATVGAMLSTSIEMFLFFRMLQAAVATCMALSRAIVRDMVPQDEAASMIGYVTMGMALVPMFGPMIGGALAQAFDWHAIFVFLTLAGLGVFALCYYDLGETVTGKGVSFADQLKGYPELFRSPRFWGYVACCAFASGAFFALLGGASFVAGEVFGLTEFWSGVALGAPAIGYAVGNFFSGRYSVKIGINLMTLVGSLITTAGLAASIVLTLAGINDPFVFFGCITLLGLGNGLTMPNAMAGSLSVRPHLAGTASGVGGAMMIGGGAALSQLAGFILRPGSGTMPLQLLMFATSILGIAAITFVMWRARQIS